MSRAIKICLDAGHYGKYNPSTTVSGYTEAERMWDLHLMLARELTERGAEVVLTRDDQKKDLELTQRGRKARGCDFFLSMHSNGTAKGTNEEVDYPAAYVMRDNSHLYEVSHGLGYKLAQTVEAVMDTAQRALIDTRPSVNDRDGNGLRDDEYYGVLQGAKEVNVPGVILEHSFHTNTRATKWLMDENNLRKLAEAEAECLAEWFGMEGTVRYKRLSDIPNNWDRAGNPRATIAKLMNAGILAGDGSDPDGNDDIIDLSHDMVRSLILEYRGGAFDRKLIAEGLEPAVEE